MIKHHSYKIQNVIQKELFAAKHSIKICVAWFTNDLLFQPLLLKLDAGVEVTIITNKDEINFADTNDVDFDEFIQRGGCIYWNERSDKSRLLHHKFCIIDDSVVISGSYNWTNGAEYNDEDITVYSEEPETTKHYSDIFDKLAAQLPKSKGGVKRTTHQEEQTIDLTQQLLAKYCEIGEYIDGLAKVCRTIGSSRLWGFVNEQGEEVIPCRYNSVEEFHSGLSVVCLGHYFGAIDNNGTEIIPFQHKSIRWRDNNFIEAYLDNDELCVYDNSGVRIDSNRIIVYTSIDGKVIIPISCSLKILSNTYLYGNGIIIFSEAIKQILGFSLDEFCYYESIGWASYDDINGHVSFYQCQELSSIFMPSNITSIGNNAFFYCKNLVSVYIPNSVTSIGASAFNECSSLMDITMSNSITEIGSHAFEGCSLLSNINIPNSVTKIGEHAFYRCDSLTSITIPDGVSEIGDGAFLGCCNIKEFKGKFAVDSGRCLIKDNTIIAYIGDSSTTYTIPEGVIEIGSHAFEGCSLLSSINIPNSVTKIGWGAFSGCSSLTRITIPYSVTEIKGYAFHACGSLTNVTIPDSVTKIEDSTFKGCTSLTSIIIPKGVKEIGSYAFEGCSLLSNINIPNSVTRIGYKAFVGCCSLTSITIPDGVSEIGDGAFLGCCNIKEFKGKFAADSGRCLIKDNTIIAYAGDSGTTYTIPEGVIEIGRYAFENCSSLLSVTIPNSIFDINGGVFIGCCNIKEFKGKFAADSGRCLIKDNTIIAYAEGSGAIYTIPHGVTKIGNYAFSGCKSLKKITIPNSVTEIGDGAFENCSSLMRIIIPNSITVIGWYAFSGCSSLIAIQFPQSVILIGDDALYNCIALTGIYCKATTPPGLVHRLLYRSHAKIHVPVGSVDVYKTDDDWKEYADQIIGYDFENEKEL